MRKAIVLLLILFTTGLLPSGSVSAHADLVKSDPANGSVLPTSPAEMTFEFSEALDPTFSSIDLLDAATQQALPSTFQVDSAKDTVLHLHFSPLKNGVYSAQWKVRAADDGHVTSGSVTFSVGKPLSPLSLLPPPGTPDPATTLPSWTEAIIRWLSYLSLALGLGSLSFGLLVWRPAFRRSGVSAQVDGQVAPLFRRTLQAGLAALIVFSIAGLIFQASQAAGNVSLNWVLFLASRTGLLILARLGLALALIFGAGRLPGVGTGRTLGWWLCLAGGIGILASFSLQSHLAATSNAAINSLVETLHVTAMVAWMGGLVPLVLILRTRKPGGVPLSILIPQFSRLALVSVGVLALSGLYTALVEVQTLQALTATTYGLAVLAKSALFLVLFGLGAVNLLVLSPRLAPLAAAAGQWLYRTVRVELLLGAGVLALAGVLTASIPALDALKAHQAQGYIASSVTDGVNITLRVAPLQIGENEFGVEIQDPRSGTGGSQVLLNLEPPQFDLGITQVETALQNNGQRYSARGSYFPVGGNWKVDVILRRTGMDDVTHSFDVTVQGATGTASEDDTPNPVPADAASLASGKDLYQGQCSSCHGANGNGNGPLASGLNPPPADLTQHAVLGVHPDGQLFDWITSGYPNSAMPAFGDTLSDKQRWDLVNFIRTLAVRR